MGHAVGWLLQQVLSVLFQGKDGRKKRHKEIALILIGSFLSPGHKQHYQANI